MKSRAGRRMCVATAVAVVVGATAIFAANSAFASPSASELRSALLTPAEAARATRTPQLKEKVTACTAPYGCDRVLRYTLQYDKAYGDRQPAHLNIWDLGSKEGAQRWIRANGANPLQDTEVVVLTDEVYTDWLPPRNGWGLAQSMQAHGQWIVTVGCYGHTRRAATACVDDLRAAQLAKLTKRKLSAP